MQGWRGNGEDTEVGARIDAKLRVVMDLGGRGRCLCESEASLVCTAFQATQDYTKRPPQTLSEYKKRIDVKLVGRGKKDKYCVLCLL